VPTDVVPRPPADRSAVKFPANDVVVPCDKVCFVSRNFRKMAADTSWATLPSLIIVEILSYLRLKDRLNAVSTCKRWRSCFWHPSLWTNLVFRLKNGSRSRSKYLADRCGRFVRTATVEFNSTSVWDVRECAKMLEILADNRNLEKLSIQPTSCHIEWPERDGRRVMDQ
jgi:hypothetical protein